MKKEVGKEEGKGNGQRKSLLTGSFVWRLFSLSGNLRGGLVGGQGVRYNIIQVSRCVLSGSWTPLIGHGQGRSLVIAVGSEVAYLVLLHS